MPRRTQLVSTRLRALSVLALTAAAAAFAQPAAADSFVAEPGRHYLTSAEIAVMKSNIARHAWARTAWEKTRASADAALGATPNPAVPRPPDVGGSWPTPVYGKGLRDGQLARTLAMAYAVTGDSRYANKAKEFALAWARSYSPLPSLPATGHDVAEPVGATIKLFMAYDLTQAAWTEQERATFKSWANAFVERSKRAVESERDSFANNNPDYPWSNGPSWQRAQAVWAAAVVGGRVLADTLAWNLNHRSRGGRDGGWQDLIENTMSSSGQMKEQLRRSSIGYALFNYLPLVLIADVTKHAGSTPNLWHYRTPSGKSLLAPAEYYAPYLAGRSGPDWSPEKAAEKRAQMELVLTNYPASAVLRNALNHGGDATRGANYDGRCCGFGALVGELVVPAQVAAAPFRPTPTPAPIGPTRLARILVPDFLLLPPRRRPTAAPSSCAWGKVVARARPAFRWGARTFTCAADLRRHLERRGQRWERFLRLHPAAVAAFRLRGVNFGEVFYTKRALVRWLAKRGLSYRVWAHLHPTAASVLEAQSDRFVPRVVRRR